MARKGTQMKIKDIDLDLDSSESSSEPKPVHKKKKRRRRRRRRYHLPGTDKMKHSDEENPYTDVLTGVDLGAPVPDPAPTVDIVPVKVGPDGKKRRSKKHRKPVE